MSIANLLNLAKAQNKKLIEWEGIIVYFDTDSVPQEVYLIPVKLDYEGSFENFVHHTFENYNGNAIDMYVQGMRWLMPNLLDEIRSLQYIKGESLLNIKGLPKGLRISSSRIYTDTSHVERMHTYPDRITEFPIQIGNTKYNLRIENLKKRFGVPQFIESVPIH
ncbi:MAG: hypothetical protein M3139_10435 [Bacteroidota bacterium]|nr:hypothetical protein [Bacteroidota bacterium]